MGASIVFDFVAIVRTDMDQAFGFLSLKGQHINGIVSVKVSCLKNRYSQDTSPNRTPC